MAGRQYIGTGCELQLYFVTTICTQGRIWRPRLCLRLYSLCCMGQKLTEQQRHHVQHNRDPCMQHICTDRKIASNYIQRGRKGKVVILISGFNFRFCLSLLPQDQPPSVMDTNPNTFLLPLLEMAILKVTWAGHDIFQQRATYDCMELSISTLRCQLEDMFQLIVMP